MNRQEVMELAEGVALAQATELVKAAPRTGLLTQPALVPATTSGPIIPGDRGSVRFDGDDTILAGAAMNITQRAFGDSERVMVLVMPSGGAFIIGAAAPSSSITLTSSGALMLTVPVGARHVTLHALLRSTAALAIDNIRVQLNGDTAAHYWDEGIYNNAGTPGAQASTNRTVGFYAGDCDAANATSGYYTPTRIEFPGAGLTGNAKEGLIDTSRESIRRFSYGWFWSGTVPVTTIQLLCNLSATPTQWVAGSYAFLEVH